MLWYTYSIAHSVQEEPFLPMSLMDWANQSRSILQSRWSVGILLYKINVSLGKGPGCKSLQGRCFDAVCKPGPHRALRTGLKEVLGTILKAWGLCSTAA